MGVLNTILLVLFVLSGILTVLLVLAHSGKGTGVSDMIAASMYNASAGSGIMEKNLLVLLAKQSLAYLDYLPRNPSFSAFFIRSLRSM